jgi:hypothetical protein
MIFQKPRILVYMGVRRHLNAVKTLFTDEHPAEKYTGARKYKRFLSITQKPLSGNGLRGKSDTPLSCSVSPPDACLAACLQAKPMHRPIRRVSSRNSAVRLCLYAEFVAARAEHG